MAVEQIKATKATEDKPADNTLPDPSPTAKWVALAIVIAAAILAIALNALSGTKTGSSGFVPSVEKEADFALFAGFYVIAQALAAFIGLVAFVLPPWKTTVTGNDPTVKAAQIKADRGTLQLAIAAFGGTLLSCLFGLFFLEAVGIHAPHTVDAFFTGALLAGGAKPLHDFVGLLSNKTAPKTGTEA